MELQADDVRVVIVEPADVGVVSVMKSHLMARPLGLVVAAVVMVETAEVQAVMEGLLMARPVGQVVTAVKSHLLVNLMEKVAPAEARKRGLGSQGGPSSG